MRKLLFVLVTVMFSYAANAASTQMGHWRWRNDDGGEATATWKAAADQPFTMTDPMETVRLRMGIHSHAYSGNYRFIMQYSSDTLGLGYYEIGNYASTYWKDIPVEGDSLRGAAFTLVSSEYVHNDSSTTDQLGPSTGVWYDIPHPFEPGALVASGTYPGVSVQTYKRYEVELAMRPTKYIQAGKTYWFRYKAVEMAYNYYTYVPWYKEYYLSDVPKFHTAANMPSVKDISATILAYLGGPFNSISETMSTALADNNLLPKTFRYVTVENINTITVGGAKVTDWVTVQLSRAATPETALYTTPALMFSDGSVRSPIAPYNNLILAATPGTLVLTIKHRNHLAAAKKVTIDATSTNAVINFSSGLTTSQMQFPSGTKALWPGDIDHDNEIGSIDVEKVKTSFLNGDFDAYLDTDVDMDTETGAVDVEKVKTSFLSGPFLDYSTL